MRYLVLSDVHGNVEALKTVLAHVRRKRWEKVLFLGDIVGYGAAPNQVVEWLRGLGSKVISVRGNHDRVCAGLDNPIYFNRYARQASLWTHDQLSSVNLKFLASMAKGPLTVEPGLVICHGSPSDEDAYIFSGHDAYQAFMDEPEARIILFGHTHVPCLFGLDEEQGVIYSKVLVGRRVVVTLKPGIRYMINPGSVGQPRDRNPYAAYGILDMQTQKFYLYRVKYNVAAAARRIIQAGLPVILAERLKYGA